MKIATISFFPPSCRLYFPGFLSCLNTRWHCVVKHCPPVTATALTARSLLSSVSCFLFTSLQLKTNIDVLQMLPWMQWRSPTFAERVENNSVGIIKSLACSFDVYMKIIPSILFFFLALCSVCIFTHKWWHQELKQAAFRLPFVLLPGRGGCGWVADADSR